MRPVYRTRRVEPGPLLRVLGEHEHVRLADLVRELGDRRERLSRQARATRIALREAQVFTLLQAVAQHLETQRRARRRRRVVEAVARVVARIHEAGAAVAAQPAAREGERVAIRVAPPGPGGRLAPPVEAPVEEAVDVPLLHHPAPDPGVDVRLVDHERRVLAHGRVGVRVPPDLLARPFALAHGRDASEEVVVPQRPDIDVVVEELVGGLDAAQRPRSRVVGEQELDAVARSGRCFVRETRIALGLLLLAAPGGLVEDVDVRLLVPAAFLVDAGHVGEIGEDRGRARLERAAPGEVTQEREPVVGQAHASLVLVEERRHPVGPGVRRGLAGRLRHLGHVVHVDRGDPVLLHHGVEVGEDEVLVPAGELEAGGQAARHRLLVDGEGRTRAEALPAEGPDPQDEGDVDDFTLVGHVVLDAQGRAVLSGGGTERHVDEDVEGRRGPGVHRAGHGLDGAELPRHERVGVPAAAGAERGGRRGDPDVEDARELGIVDDQRVAVLRPAEAHLAGAAAYAHLDPLILIAGGVDADGLTGAGLGGGEGARGRRDHPDGGLRHAGPREQQRQGEGGERDAGRREADRPRSEGARLRRPPDPVVVVVAMRHASPPGRMSVPVVSARRTPGLRRPRARAERAQIVE